jgi:hypothetical protein
MSDTPEKLRITAADVNDKKVDDVLSQQMSFGMPSVEPSKDRSAWYYKSWFVLMVAGAIGGFLGWMAIEPFCDDYVTFRGKIDSIDAEATMPGAENIAGRINVAGVSVWMFGKEARMDLGDGQKLQPLNLTKLHRGQVVDVSGEVATMQHPILIGLRVKVRPGDVADYPTPDLVSLKFRDFLTSVLVVFPLVAGFVGMAIGGADGALSRAYGRALICALVGLGMGLVAGIVASVAAHILYAVFGVLMAPLQRGTGESAGAFMLQMMSRGIAWALAGIAMGLGQGIALRSKKLFMNGLIGGTVGGLLGGLLFDPINRMFHGDDAMVSRAIGFVVIGLVTGLMVGIVELIAREAWLKMLAGPLAGKEFVLYKDPTSIGSSPKREVYLFKDPDVEPVHALVRRVGEGYEIEDQKTPAGVLLNGRKVTRARLKSQDQIRIGSTVLLFTMKED